VKEKKEGRGKPDIGRMVGVCGWCFLSLGIKGKGGMHMEAA
jgi:hypothetical protein